MDIKTPFSDAVEKMLGKKGTKGGEYDQTCVPDTPHRDMSSNGLAELTYDTAITSKDPGLSGPYKTPFKDAID